MADRVRRQTSTWAVLYPRPGKRSRRLDPTVAVDVFVLPKDQTRNKTRDAMHLLACCKWVESARIAIAINISPDAEALATPWPLGAFSRLELMWIASLLNLTRQTQIFLATALIVL